jgi:pyruvate/2-oxoglutarate dehydrogenase complex dihydrolipoamide acyltransferase (E2) component
MAVEIPLAKLGVEMEVAILTGWMVEDGSEIAAEQNVLTVETEKVIFEVSAPAAGILRHVAEVGEEYAVGDLLALVAADAEEFATLGDGAVSPESPGSVESLEPAAVAAGSVGEASRPKADLVSGNGGPASAADRDTIASRRRAEPLASPLARRIARENDLVLEGVDASGPGGKILRRDVERALADAASTPRKAADALSPAPLNGEPSVVPLGATRRTIARRMLASLQETAQMTDVREYDVSSLVDLRRGLVAHQESLGYKVSFTDLFVRAAAIALRTVPALNATFADGDLSHYPEAHIGVAVAVEDGLVVPVLHGAGGTSLREMHSRLEALIERARTRKANADDLSGGTFTVTNIGSYGSQFGTPVLNPPQVAILGTGAFQQKPVVRDGHIVVGTTMYLSLTVDHRVIDGEVAGRFLNAMGDLFAEPNLILVG